MTTLEKDFEFKIPAIPMPNSTKPKRSPLQCAEFVQSPCSCFGPKNKRALWDDVVWSNSVENKLSVRTSCGLRPPTPPPWLITPNRSKFPLSPSPLAVGWLDSAQVPPTIVPHGHHRKCSDRRSKLACKSDSTTTPKLVVNSLKRRRIGSHKSPDATTFCTKCNVKLLFP